MMREITRLTGLKLKTEHLLVGAGLALLATIAWVGKDSSAFVAKVTQSTSQPIPEIIRLNPISGVTSIAAAGDFSTNSNSTKVMGQMRNRQMILPLGDYNYSSEHGSSYASKWYNLMFGSYSGYVLPNLGNHDIEEAMYYLSLFGLPGWSYSVDIGAVHLLVLNTEAPVSGAAVDADLADARARGKMLLVSHHIALKGRTPSQNSYFYRDIPSWQQAFDKNKVELVLAGHSHYYVRYKTSASSVGTTYMIVGTGGADFNQFPSSTTGIAKYYKTTHGYLRISVHSSYLECKFVDKYGSTKDSFNVYKK